MRPVLLSSSDRLEKSAVQFGGSTHMCVCTNIFHLCEYRCVLGVNSYLESWSPVCRPLVQGLDSPAPRSERQAVSCVALSALDLLPRWPCEDSARVGPPLRALSGCAFSWGCLGRAHGPPGRAVCRHRALLGAGGSGVSPLCSTSRAGADRPSPGPC